MKLNFKDIEEKGLLLYKYIRGSHVYGTNTETSDIDEGGIYICPNDQLLDLGFDYQNEVCDEKHDTCWWEIGKFMKLLLSSNPTVLEALFVPDDKVLYEPTEEQRKIGYIHFVRWNGKEISENDKYNLYQIIDDIEEGTYLLKVRDEE